MNGIATRKPYGYDGGRQSPAQGSGSGNGNGVGLVGGKTLVEGYRKEILNGFDQDKPLYNPMNAERPQSSPLVDLKDPIQVHLLTETALSDSREWEILSQEEVDDLKKQIQSLTQRIEQARANLAIQSKYRDAAISMSKLYSPGKRRSLLGNRSSGGDKEAQREADAERQAIEHRCEELAAELFSLEKRLMEPQRRLLQHTAGILQLTHKTPKRQPPTAGLPPNGIPGSPESMYTYSNGRNSLEPGDDAFFDDRSLYFPLEDGQFGRPRKNTLEIPQKSPIREQTNQLREEGDRLRDENRSLRRETEQLRLNNDSLNNEVDMLKAQSADQFKLISKTERKLEELNVRLRDVIIEFDPEKNSRYSRVPTGKLEPGELLGSQLDYLAKGLKYINDERSLQASSSGRDAETVAKLEDFNGQVHGILQTVAPDYPLPPTQMEGGLDQQLDWLEESLRAIDSELTRALDNSSATSADRQKTEQVETVLEGLWDIIQSGYADIQQRKEDRRKTRLAQGLQADEDDMSGDESFDTSETYSLQAFSARVQWLYAQATRLKEQKSVLKRQIKQQRELNNKSDTAKDAELQQKVDELQQTRDLLDRTEKEAQDAQEKLVQALADLDMYQQSNAANESAAVKAVQDQLKEKNAALASLETTTKELQGKLSAVEGQLSTIDEQLREASEAKNASEAAAEKLQHDVQAKEKELEDMNVMIIELKTEVTIARAELDGAYGSRAQRAAEVAALTKGSEITDLQGQVDKLKSELASTLKEFEDMTKETIASEKEKIELEGRLDDALSAKTSLETEVRALREKLEAEVSRLQEQLDAERLKVGPGQGAGSKPGAGASMLSEQFRATMKEERRKFQEELREEQGKRRRLEDELRALKKAQGPGKSPLSPR